MSTVRSTFLILLNLFLWAGFDENKVLAKELVVYNEEMESFEIIHEQIVDVFLQRQKEVHTLRMVVRLIPDEKVIDVYSLRPVGENEKKAANSSVRRCVTVDTVRDPLNEILNGFRSKKDVSEETNKRFHKALFQCLEPSRPSQLTWAVEFQTDRAM